MKKFLVSTMLILSTICLMSCGKNKETKVEDKKETQIVETQTKKEEANETNVEKVESVEKLEEKLSFEVRFPDIVDIYERTTVETINENTAKAKYEDGNGNVLTAKKSLKDKEVLNDKPLDFTNEEILSLNDKQVTLYSIDDKYSLSTWEDEIYSYWVFIRNNDNDTENGVDRNTIISYITNFME